MWRLSLKLLLSLVLVFPVTAISYSKDRVALVVGNAAYENAKTLALPTGQKITDWFAHNDVN